MFGLSLVSLLVLALVVGLVGIFSALAEYHPRIAFMGRWLGTAGFLTAWGIVLWFYSNPDPYVMDTFTGVFFSNVFLLLFAGIFHTQEFREN